MQSVQRFVPVVLRYLVGIIFFVFGLNGFLHFLPMPPIEGPAGAFLGALAATGYMFPVVKATEVVGAVLLLTNRFVPLALTLLAPVIVNIFLFHTVLTPPNPIAIFLLLAEIALAWSYRDAFRPMLAAKVAPSAPQASDASAPARAAA
jgi:hypothetical protein